MVVLQQDREIFNEACVEAEQADVLSAGPAEKRRICRPGVTFADERPCLLVVATGFSAALIRLTNATGEDSNPACYAALQVEMGSGGVSPPNSVLLPPTHCSFCAVPPSSPSLLGAGVASFSLASPVSIAPNPCPRVTLLNRASVARPPSKIKV